MQAISQGCDKKKKKKKKKKSTDTHTLGSCRDLNQSEIVKGRPPPLIGRGTDIPVRVCTFDACAAAVRQTER